MRTGRTAACRSSVHSSMRRAASFVLVLWGLCGLFLSSAPGAGNEEWKYFGSNEKGERFFYDAASVMYFSNISIRVWTRELTAGPPTKRLKEINCESKVIRDLQVTVETADKAPRANLRPGEWRAIENVPPMKELYKVLCR